MRPEHKRRVKLSGLVTTGAELSLSPNSWMDDGAEKAVKRFLFVFLTLARCHALSQGSQVWCGHSEIIWSRRKEGNPAQRQFLLCVWISLCVCRGHALRTVGVSPAGRLPSKVKPCFNLLLYTIFHVNSTQRHREAGTSLTDIIIHKVIFNIESFNQNYWP